MSLLDSALTSVGVDLGFDAADSISSAIDEFASQTVGIDLLTLGRSILDTGQSIGSQAQTLGSSQRAQGSTGGSTSNVAQPAQGNGSGGGAAGDWESVHYANDLIPHQPKFKFLFKVGFYGFGGGPFYYFVHRCEKPKVAFNHTDVNYYNFRTRVLTSTTFQPLTMTFLDEIGNSSNAFFATYLAQRSGQGNGYWGINRGFSDASSSIPYDTGYSKGTEIIIEQIYANGTRSNHFHFLNPRIESMEFDEMDMSANDVNYFTLSFSYDAISCKTIQTSTIHTWGETDIHRGGGVAGSNGGAHGGGSSPQRSIGSTGGVGGANNEINQQRELDLLSTLQNYGLQTGLPPSLEGVNGIFSPDLLGGFGSFNDGNFSSGTNTLNQDIQTTIGQIESGANLGQVGLPVDGGNPNNSIPPDEFRNP